MSLKKHQVSPTDLIKAPPEEGDLLGKPAAILPRTTVAIFGYTSVVTRTLELLLQGIGYEVRLLREPEAYKPEELLEGIDVLLFDANLDEDRRENFVKAMASITETAHIPLLTLSTDFKETLTEKANIVAWPCSTEELARRIEVALRAAMSNEALRVKKGVTV